MDVPLAGWPGAGDVQLLEIGREAQAVGIPPIHLRWQLLPSVADANGLTNPVVELACLVALAACGIRRAFVELRAVRWVGEPDAAIRMRNYVIGRVEPFALERVGEHGDRAVELITD